MGATKRAHAKHREATVKFVDWQCPLKGGCPDYCGHRASATRRAPQYQPLSYHLYLRFRPIAVSQCPDIHGAAQGPISTRCFKNLTRTG